MSLTCFRVPESLASKIQSHIREDAKSIAAGRQTTLPNIQVKPVDEKNPSNDFIFIFDKDEYPALVSNLRCYGGLLFFLICYV